MVAGALAPRIVAFLVCRALQGTANAFLTPLLLAGLADEVPPRQMGRAVGTLAAIQTAAVALSPLVGGLLGGAVPSDPGCRGASCPSGRRAGGCDRLAASLPSPRRGHGRARAPAAARR